MIIKNQNVNWEKALQYQVNLKNSLDYFRNNNFPDLLILSGKNRNLKYYAIIKTIKNIFCEHQNSCDICKSCLLINKQEHPDLIFFPEDNIKIGNPDDPEEYSIRWLQEKILVYKPVIQKQRFIIIPKAEFLGDEAEIALLKTLEEPVSESKFIFFVDNTDYLKETILSRGILISVRNFSSSEIDELVNNYHINQYEFFEVSGGNLDFITTEYYHIYTHIKEQIQNGLQHPIDFFELENEIKKHQLEVQDLLKETEFWELFCYIFLQIIRKSPKYVLFSEVLIKFLILLRADHHGILPYLVSRLFYELSMLIFF